MGIQYQEINGIERVVLSARSQTGLWYRIMLYSGIIQAGVTGL